MIVGVGCDIIEIERIARAIKRGECLLLRKLPIVKEEDSRRQQALQHALLLKKRC